MLDPSEFRPEDAVTIYTRQVSLPIIEDQLKNRSDTIKDAFNAGLLSLSLRDPTKTKMGAILVDVSQLDTTLGEVLSPVQQAARDMGFGPGAVGIAFTTGTVEVPIEMYEQSAFVKQVTHTVADLPD